METKNTTAYPWFPGTKFLYADKKIMPWVWLVVRLYVGYEWLMAGWEKVQNPLWVGGAAGGPLKGFLMGSLAKMSGAHPDVSSWYGWMISHIALPHTVLISNIVSFSELFVGIALILGLFTGVAAFFGAFMNANYLLAGTVSINPLLLILQFFLMLAWRIAGYIGFDRFIVPKLKFKQK